MTTTDDDSQGDGLIYALLLDGAGGARTLSWDQVDSWAPEMGLLWLHFDYMTDGAREWLLNKSGLGEIAAEALLSQETRPRATSIDDSALLALRGINLNPGSDPEDMVSIRVWMDRQRIISSRNRRLLSAADIVQSLLAGRGPRDAGEFIVDLTDRLTERAETTIADIEERVDDMEAAVLAGATRELRSAVSETRREAIVLRRYLAPQREAILRLSAEKLTWLSEDDRMHLREVADKLIRYVEELDSVRDRASVTQEELVGKMSEQLNSRMYVLALLSALFLPLGFLTGLLGVNLGGLPGAGSEWGFAGFVLILVAVVGLQIWLFKRNKWL